MLVEIFKASAGRIAGLLGDQTVQHVNLVRGAEKEVSSLVEELLMLRNFLGDAEDRRFNKEIINRWLSRLEQTSYQMEDVLDEWIYALRKLELEEEHHHHPSDDDAAVTLIKKVCSFIPCLCFFTKKVVVRYDIATKIRNEKAQLDDILKDKDRYNLKVSQPVISNDHLPDPLRTTTSLVDLMKVHGRDADRDFLVSKVLDEGVSQGQSAGIPVLSIVGVGGLGKTTLAQQVYNDTQVEKWFGEFRIWVCVSDPFDPAAIARGVLEKIGVGAPNTNLLDPLLHRLTESLSGKRFLLVLDDVWTDDENKWESLRVSLIRCGGMGSKILVTTRKENVAIMMGSRDAEICRPGLLSDEDCWSLLCRVALPERNENEYKEIGMKIVQKCDGLPLAVKTLGSLLRFKKNLHEWENVLKSEIWEMKEAEVDLFPHLLLSYKELSPTQKRCFSYCAVYLKDFDIDVESLIGDWIALGYLGSDDKCDMEVEGRNYFDVLAMRSLFQDLERDIGDEIIFCKMHDIVHDFAQFLRKNGRMVEGALEINKASCGVCDPLLVSKVNEFRSLDWQGECPSNICDCLIPLRVLSHEESIPRGMVKLIHLRSLTLSWVRNISQGDVINIFQLYHLQTLIFRDCNLDMIPGEIKNLIHLRHLELSKNKSLDKLPKEIGELIKLRHLDLSENMILKELPEEIGNLIELRRLLSSECQSLEKLPESLGGLRQLEILDVDFSYMLCKLPEGLRQLTSLRSLKGFNCGRGGSKLGILKKLNSLGGELKVRIRLDDGLLEEGGIVEDAREAELRTKIHLKELEINFEDSIWDERSSSGDSVRMGVLDALHPHPNLQTLYIRYYKGSKLPMWMGSPLNRLKKLSLSHFPKLKSLPTLGRLPCLETLFVLGIPALERVGREFTGIEEEDENSIGVSNTNTNSNLPPLAFFPNLKKLKFNDCPKWKEWEDIRAEESDEEPTFSFSYMPSLTRLEIWNCPGLTALPHHLLRKATSLQVIKILDSPLLEECYRDKEAPTGNPFPHIILTSRYPSNY